MFLKTLFGDYFILIKLVLVRIVYCYCPLNLCTFNYSLELHSKLFSPVNSYCALPTLFHVRTCTHTFPQLAVYIIFGICDHGVLLTLSHVSPARLLITISAHKESLPGGERF